MCKRAQALGANTRNLKAEKGIGREVVVGVVVQDNLKHKKWRRGVTLLLPR